MTPTIWLIALYIMNGVPQAVRTQRFDTIEHCRAFADLINPTQVKTTIRFACAEGLLEAVKPALTEDSK